MHCLEVWGDLACFTRPEMKVERFSYPVINPSAARGIFDAIYWEGIREKDNMRPYFYWQIRRIEVLKIPQYIALRRNEVKDKVPSDRTIAQWISGETQPEPIWADGGKNELGTDQKGRTQRQTMALKNVHYRLYADIVPHPDFRAELGKYNAMFERRAKRGQCFQQPYFGCREFPAYFEWFDKTSSIVAPDNTINLKIGWMIYDVFDLTKDRVSMIKTEPFISVFEASIIAGILDVPEYRNAKVHRPSRGESC